MWDGVKHLGKSSHCLGLQLSQAENPQEAISPESAGLGLHKLVFEAQTVNTTAPSLTRLPVRERIQEGKEHLKGKKLLF